MKKYLGCFLCIMLLAIGAQAHALSITPSTTPLLAYGSDSSQSDIDDIILGLIGTDVELYKSDVGDEENPIPVESGALAGRYETVYSNEPLNPSVATITYTGGLTVGSPAHLLVKDGNQDPNWYLWELTTPELGWDGMEKLELTGFWTGQGAISHVSLYGSASVPEPATMLLLGFGLVGLAGFRRKKFKK